MLIKCVYYAYEISVYYAGQQAYTVSRGKSVQCRR